MGHVPPAAPLSDRTRRLELHVARWIADGSSGGDSHVGMLRRELPEFCRDLHAAGVHGPTVRRLAGATVRAGAHGRVPDDLRERMARDAQRIVDVIYLTGEHRTA